MDSLLTLFRSSVTSQPIQSSVLKSSNGCSAKIKNSKSSSKKDFKENIEPSNAPTILVEKIRHERESLGLSFDEGNDDYLVHDGQINIESHQVMCVASRLKNLKFSDVKNDLHKLPSERKTCPPSPSFDHREKATILPEWDGTSHSPLSLFFPNFCGVYLTVGHVLAGIHTYENRFSIAEGCLKSAVRAYDQMQHSIKAFGQDIEALMAKCPILPSLSKAKRKSDPCQVPECSDGNSSPSQLLSADIILNDWCCIQQRKVEILCCQNYFEEASDTLSSSINFAVDHFPQQMLLRHHLMLLPLLLLQSTRLQKAIKAPATNLSSPVVTLQVPEVESPLNGFPSTPNLSENRFPALSRPPPLKKSLFRTTRCSKKSLASRFTAIKNDASPLSSLEDSANGGLSGSSSSGSSSSLNNQEETGASELCEDLNSMTLSAPNSPSRPLSPSSRLKRLMASCKKDSKSKTASAHAETILKETKSTNNKNQTSFKMSVSKPEKAESSTRNGSKHSVTSNSSFSGKDKKVSSNGSRSRASRSSNTVTSSPSESSVADPPKLRVTRNTRRRVANN